MRRRPPVCRPSEIAQQGLKALENVFGYKPRHPVLANLGANQLQRAPVFPASAATRSSAHNTGHNPDHHIIRIGAPPAVANNPVDCLNHVKYGKRSDISQYRSSKLGGGVGGSNRTAACSVLNKKLSVNCPTIMRVGTLYNSFYTSCSDKELYNYQQYLANRHRPVAMSRPDYQIVVTSKVPTAPAINNKDSFTYVRWGKRFDGSLYRGSILGGGVGGSNRSSACLRHRKSVSDSGKWRERAHMNAFLDTASRKGLQEWQQACEARKEVRAQKAAAAAACALVTANPAASSCVSQQVPPAAVPTDSAAAVTIDTVAKDTAASVPTAAVATNPAAPIPTAAVTTDTAAGLGRHYDTTKHLSRLGGNREGSTLDHGNTTSALRVSAHRDHKIAQLRAWAKELDAKWKAAGMDQLHAVQCS